jgi:hypothetical protein
MKAKSKAQSLGEEGRHPRFRVSRSAAQRPAAADYLSRFLCVGFALALAVTGCVGPRPLKGGKAITTRKPTGVIEQTLLQGENPSQATKQDQESVKVRTYTLPAGSRIEQSQTPAAPPAQLSTINSQPINLQPSTTLYTARYGVPPVGKKVYVRVNQFVDGWEDLPVTFSAIVPASA